jgi:hypothetical protein
MGPRPHSHHVAAAVRQKVGLGLEESLIGSVRASHPPGSGEFSARELSKADSSGKPKDLPDSQPGHRPYLFLPR